MSVFRVILSIIFPPLAVIDKGLVILNKQNNVPTYPTYPTTTNSRTRCDY